MSQAHHTGSSGQAADPLSWEAPQPLSFRSSSLPSSQANVQSPFEPADWLSQTQQLSQQEADPLCSVPNKAPAPASESCQVLHVHSPGVATSKIPEEQQPQTQQKPTASSSMKRKSAGSPSDKRRQTVLIWDLDETLILFHSLLSGQYADHHSPEVTARDVSLYSPRSA